MACAHGQMEARAAATLPVASTPRAGFPLRELPPSLPGYTARAAEGISGDDLESCPSSILPGVCAFASAVDAATICATLPECRAVTFYAEGAQPAAAGHVACSRATNCA